MTLPLKSAEVGWSFCIPTVNGSEWQLAETLNSIFSEFSNPAEFEVIVIGSCLIDKLQEQLDPELIKQIQFLPFKEKNFSFNWKHFRRAFRKGQFQDVLMRSGWITRKKNVLAQCAKFENICLMHDYVSLKHGWRDGFRKYGFDWDVCVNTILNKNQTRHRDWLVWDYPEIGAALLPYGVGHLSQFMYISGTYFCVKKNFFLNNPLDETLYWGESEDVEWSMRVRKLIHFRFNPYSEVCYVKDKPLNEAPYCDEWKARALLLNEKLGLA